MKLYKYRSIEVGKKILQTKMLRASNFIHLNDPFDFTIESLFGKTFHQSNSEVIESMTNSLLSTESVSPDKIRSTEIKLIQNKIKGMTVDAVDQLKLDLKSSLDADSTILNDVNVQKYLNIFKLSFQLDGVICFSKKPDINPMWGHYGDNHTGMVLCFEPNLEKDSFLRVAEEVLYREIRPLLHSSNKDFFKNSFHRADEDVLKEYIANIHYSKCRSWSYEEELRVVLPQMIDSEIGYKDFTFYPDEVHSIYFGCRTTDIEISETAKIALKCNPLIQFYRMKPDKFSYQLIEEKIKIESCP